MPLGPEVEEMLDRYYMTYAAMHTARERLWLAAERAAAALRVVVKAYWGDDVN